MSKAVKKTTKKSTRKAVNKKAIEMESISSISTDSVVMPVRKMSNKTLTLGMIVIVLALLTYKLGPWVFPAIVANRPVSRFELWSRLEHDYGSQVLDDIVNEKILNKAIADAKIKIDQSKVDEQLKDLESRYANQGGLDEALKQNGLTRKDLIKQIETQLSVEILLADKITVSEEDLKKQFDLGATTIYKDKSFEEVKDGLMEELKQTKLRDEFLAWFSDIKKAAKVTNFGL